MLIWYLAKQSAFLQGKGSIIGWCVKIVGTFSSSLAFKVKRIRYGLVLLYVLSFSTCARVSTCQCASLQSCARTSRSSSFAFTQRRMVQRFWSYTISILINERNPCALRQACMKSSGIVFPTIRNGAVGAELLSDSFVSCSVLYLFDHVWYSFIRGPPECFISLETLTPVSCCQRYICNVWKIAFTGTTKNHAK